MKNKSEKGLIATIEREFGRGRSKRLSQSIGDDAALWTPASGCQTVLTCDWFLEGTHFLRGKHSADAVGWKCLARATSDLAAMGARPRCFLLSLAMPRGATENWFRQFLRGLRRASEALRCELAGGDTTRNDKILISITVVGEVRRGRAILRSGAAPGEAIYVSGTLGEAELGLRKLRRKRSPAKPTSAALRKHLYPQPRLALGEWLAKNCLATAMMDLSDGLSTDLPRLCEASRVGAVVDLASLPVTSLAPVEEAQALALRGGDDYELLFTVAKKNAGRLPQQFRGLRLTRIGEITSGKQILLKRAPDKTLPLPSSGWDPFR
jgi:thiamine-monophosphate kinase